MKRARTRGNGVNTLPPARFGLPGRARIDANAAVDLSTFAIPPLITPCGRTFDWLASCPAFNICVPKYTTLRPGSAAPGPGSPPAWLIPFITFKTLVAAVTAAGLVDTLKGAGPFTVFAPSDEAFAKLPAGTVEALLADIPKLSAILTYHVVAGKVMAADVLTMNGQSAATVNGASVKISTTDGVKLNDGINVTATDIACTNGVIHVIDAVLIPA